MFILPVKKLREFCTFLSMEKNLLEERRARVITLHLAGKRPCEILCEIRREGFTKLFIHRTIARYKETSSISDRKRTGRPRSARTRELIKQVRERIRRNPERSQNQLAKQLNTSRTAIQNVIKIDLKMRPFKRRRGQLLDPRQMHQRKLRCDRLLLRHDDESVKRIIFSDEKYFVIRPVYIAQNRRCYAASFSNLAPKHKYATQVGKSAGVMVWTGVSHHGKLPLVFVRKGVKINAEVYIAEILEPYMKNPPPSVTGGDEFIFQQDSAPAHFAKVTQEWCRQNLPDFIEYENWPACSPDLNPLDYYVWSQLQSMLGFKAYTSVEALKAKLLEAWDQFPMEPLRAAIASWRHRLMRCSKKGGGYFDK